MSCRKNIFLNAAAAFFLVAAAFSSCREEKPLENPFVSLDIPRSEVVKSKDSQFISISSNGDWTLDLNYPDDQKGWARLKEESGSLSGRTTLYWDQNDSGRDRQVIVVAKCAGESSSVIVKQSATGSISPITPDNLKPDPVPGWLELPDTDVKGRYFIRHYMTLGNAQVRNFSLFLSPEDRIAVWVAYPLNRRLIGSGDRTDAWGLDPRIPRNYQAVINRKSFSGYQRGHQIPSADRYAPGANEATFYGSNMTPQLKGLNEFAWAHLEGYVREWSYGLDTLYVVTGADVSGRTEVVNDNDNKAVTVPNGYFKALLGYKKNASSQEISGQVSGYVGIAFYFDHESCSDNGAALLDNHSMSIDALESRLGIDFFVNLPAKVGSDNSSRIESSVSSWWKTKLKL